MRRFQLTPNEAAGRRLADERFKMSQSQVQKEAWAWCMKTTEQTEAEEWVGHTMQGPVHHTEGTQVCFSALSGPCSVTCVREAYPSPCSLSTTPAQKVPVSWGTLTWLSDSLIPS